MTPPGQTAESLLAHAGWVRVLAGALVRDPHLADDLVQETWLAALQSEPRRVEEERGWLAAVLRNVLRQRRRGEGRRAAHEAQAWRADESESTLDVVARAQDQRGLVEAVLALDEPYRTTVLLRYFEGLPPRAIAARRSVPLATVKSQLARGLARLREHLDREHGGDGRAWVLALAPLVPKQGGLGAAGTGVLIVETKWKLALAGLVAAGALTGTIVLQSSAPEALPPRASDGVAAATLPESRPRPAVPPATSEHRAALTRSNTAEIPVEVAAPESVGAAPAVAVRGRAFDEEGQPLAGAALRLTSSVEAGPERAPSAAAAFASGSGGWFELELEDDAGFVVAADGERATVLAARVRRSASGAPPIVVLAPRAALAGRVVDELGAPVPAAHVGWFLPNDFRARFGEVLDTSVTIARNARTDADGRFALPDAPSVREAELAVEAEGFEPLRQPAPLVADANVLLVLTRPVVDARSVIGRVIDAHGDPVEGAHVALGLDSTRSDAGGLFAFDLDAERSITRMYGFEADRLLALKPGFLPVERRAERDEQGRPVWPTEVVLRLAGEPLSIAGSVARADGSPAAGAFVWVADPSVFGDVEGRPALAESMVAGTPEEPWRRVEADGEGRFTLDNLLDRTYRVEAMDPRTLLRVGVDGVHAGAEHVSIVLSDEDLYPTVSGRVVSRSGAPVAGATIFPMCDALVGRHAGRRLFTSHHAVEGVTTDADGRFELKDVPRDLVYLRIDGDELIPLEYGRGVEGGLKELCGGRVRELEIEVPLRCHMKVEVGPECLADSLCVLDDQGRRVVINVYEGQRRSENEVVPLSAGRSSTLALTDAAVTLVLLRGEEELERIPLALTPGEVNLVQP